MRLCAAEESVPIAVSVDGVAANGLTVAIQ
jgi:hypothetical protein